MHNYLSDIGDETGLRRRRAARRRPNPFAHPGGPKPTR
jgi:hypothetical protein